MKKITVLIAVLLVLLLSGCMQTIEEMYQLPKRSDIYSDLQSSIDSAMSGLSYCAPLTGENQQTVQMADLDGDGIHEYLLFAKSTQEKPLRILVFRSVAGEFVNTETVACNGSAFDQVEYVDMDGDGGMEIIVGRQLSDQVIRSVSVYKLKNEEMVQLVTATYNKFLAIDLDGDNCQELFLLRPGPTDTDNGVAELYRMSGGDMERYNEVPMSCPSDQLKRMIVGKLSGGESAVFAASAAGESSLITDVYALRDGLLKNIALSNESGTAVQTLRNYYVYADDIDDDGIVELPNLIVMQPVEGSTNTDSNHLIRWYAMNMWGKEIDKLYTYHNFVSGWYMQLDNWWAPRLFVQSQGNQCAFYIWSNDYRKADLVMTVYAFTAQNRESQASQSGLFVLQKTESVVYAAQLEACAGNYGITQESAIYSFRLIQKDWKTGET